MNRKYISLGPLTAALALALVGWVVLPAPVVHADDASAIGAWYVGDGSPSGARGDPGGGSDPGWEADPDSFQIDIWNGAPVQVAEPAPPSAGLPGTGIIGWLMGWLLRLFSGQIGR